MYPLLGTLLEVHIPRGQIASEVLGQFHAVELGFIGSEFATADQSNQGPDRHQTLDVCDLARARRLNLPHGCLTWASRLQLSDQQHMGITRSPAYTSQLAPSHQDTAQHPPSS